MRYAEYETCHAMFVTASAQCREVFSPCLLEYPTFLSGVKLLANEGLKMIPRVEMNKGKLCISILGFVNQSALSTVELHTSSLDRGLLLIRFTRNFWNAFNRICEALVENRDFSSSGRRLHRRGCFSLKLLLNVNSMSVANRTHYQRHFTGWVTWNRAV